MLKHLVYASIVAAALFAQIETVCAATWADKSLPPDLTSIQDRPLYSPTCRHQVITYRDSRNSIPATKGACIVTGDGMRFAYSLDNSGVYVSLGVERMYYRLNVSPYDQPIFLPQNTLILSVQDSHLINGTITMYKNLQSRLYMNLSPDVPYYNIVGPSDTFPGDGTMRSISMAASENGRFVVYAWGSSYGYYGAVYRVDLVTGSYRRIGSEGYEYNYNPLPPPEYTISNDGTQVAEVGAETVKFWQVDDTCRESTVWAEGYGEDECKNTSINLRLVDQQLSYPAFPYLASSLPAFDDLANEFSVNFGDYRVQFRAKNASYLNQLDYLALGDSYSSGEGDIDTIGDTDVKWYIPWTDNDATRSSPEEKCHISSRSYPYLLAAKMNLDYTTEWRSVACSGATAWDIKEQGSISYLGQGDRLSGFDAGDLKNTALNEFIPGRQKQIEFVKKYKPKAITLTVGGNDIDFGGKLTICVKSLPTCHFATTDERRQAQNEIYHQFENLQSLYTEILQASPETKLYVLGYPQFINADPRASCSDTLLLNTPEREYIVNSVIYLNNVIEAAAKSSGAIYVDTEGALGGHRLCDQNESHMSAIIGHIGYLGGDKQESFHPNHLGHKDIAESVIKELGNDFVNRDTCPGSTASYCPDDGITADSATVPPYFAIDDPGKDKLMVYYKLTNGTLVLSDHAYDVRLGLYVMQPDTKVDITLYSDPTDLGSYDVGGDGSLSVKVSFPSDLPLGYHTITVEGISYSGEPIKLYQTIEVRGSNPDDIDDDGIEDTRDKCLYIDNNLPGCGVVGEPKATNKLPVAGNSLEQTDQLYKQGGRSGLGSHVLDDNLAYSGSGITNRNVAKSDVSDHSSVVGSINANHITGVMSQTQWLKMGVWMVIILFVGGLMYSWIYVKKK